MLIKKLMSEGERCVCVCVQSDKQTHTALIMTM